MPVPTSVYLDAHSTTPVDPRVVEKMLPFFTERFGNAASRDHAFGWAAEEAVDEARDQVAALIGASPKEIVWTSGATEADNLALLGAGRARKDRGDGVITCVTEHRAVLDPAAELERLGFRVTTVGVDRMGIIDLDELRNALDERTVLVSVMAANNEIGTLQPIREIASLVHSVPSALFHTDAAQAAGRIPIDVEADGIDLLSLSGHKIYGPKGVGALFVRRRNPNVRLVPLIRGGGHERGLRSGTLNVPGIVGMGQAFEIAAAEMAVENGRVRELRDRLHTRLDRALEDVRLNGHPERRLPNCLNVSFEGVEAEEIMREMPEICVSTGAACSSASADPSHVIEALGFSSGRAQSSIRFGLSRFTTEEEIELAADRAIAAVRKLRRLVGSDGGDVERDCS